MSKKTETLTSPLFAFGLDAQSGKPRGARFPEGLPNNAVDAALRSGCRIVQNHSSAFTAIGMKLPIGRIYASGKAFIPNIRRDLFEKLEAGRQLPPEQVPGIVTVDRVSAPSNDNTRAAQGSSPHSSVPPVAGLPDDWKSIVAGQMVLASDGPGEGYWEAIIVQRNEDVLTLRYRDYPKAAQVQKHITAVALLHPGPS